jgi:bifunctional non-homologous end joining protein LigD
VSSEPKEFVGWISLPKLLERGTWLTPHGTARLIVTATDGRDLRLEPIETRKAALLKLLRRSDYGIFLNEHIEDEASIVFQHACKLGLEGIVSKRRGSLYVSGRSQHWLKVKNPNSAAVKREAEEEWG